MIPYFPRDEIKLFKFVEAGGGAVKTRSMLFTVELFYGPDFHRGTLRGGFSQGTMTGC